MKVDETGIQFFYVAKNSLKAGVFIDVIAKITGLSLDEIKQLGQHK